VDDIVARAELAKGTFYYHFSDITAILDELSVELFSEFARLLAELRRPVSSPMGRIARAVDGHLRYVAQDPEWGKMLVLAAANIPKSAIPSRPDLIEDLELARKAGLLRFRNVGLAADVVLAMVIEATAIICSDPHNSRKVNSETVAAVLRALGLTPGAADKVRAQVEKMPPLVRSSKEMEPSLQVQGVRPSKG
jgi:AcrR family transcriptional regulator